jgi:hypothetical protein
MGIGVALIIAGAAISLALNGVYWQQRHFLLSQGYDVSVYAVERDVIGLISLGVVLALFGVYFVGLGVANQFSVKARVAWARKDLWSRFGNGFIVGGFIFASLSAAQWVREWYAPYYTADFGVVQIVIIASGLILTLVGVFFMRTSYLKSIEPTKV